MSCDCFLVLHIFIILTTGLIVVSCWCYLCWWNYFCIFSCIYSERWSLLMQLSLTLLVWIIMMNNLIFLTIRLFHGKINSNYYYHYYLTLLCYHRQILSNTLLLGALTWFPLFIISMIILIISIIIIYDVSSDLFARTLTYLTYSFRGQGQRISWEQEGSCEKSDTQPDVKY